MKIGAVHITAETVSEPFARAFTANAERVISPGTTVAQYYVPHLRRASDAAFMFPNLLNRVDIIRQMRRAEQDGCDAVTVLCSGDPGVLEGRTVVGIPLVGPMEAALHLALTYGPRVGIVTVADISWAEFERSLVQSYGLSAHLVSVRKIEIDSKTAFTQGFVEPAPIAAEIHTQARRAVEDGADSVVIASAGLSTIASASGLAQVEGVGAPIFDCLMVGLKMAELRASLRIGLGVPEVSRAGLYERFPEEDIERLFRLFELTDPVRA
jgi:allantoin racemase